jgi:hypothetical protein
MNKQVFLITFLCILFLSIQAQKGNHSISIYSEISPPVFQEETGFGFSGKGSLGILRSAQLTISFGASFFHSENADGTGSTTTRVVPLLFGYKQYFRKFFLEPQVGIGELGGRFWIDGDYRVPSVGAFFAGVKAGYHLKRFHFGAGYVYAKGFEGESAGLWYNKTFNYTSLLAGYDLFSRQRN